MIDIIIVNWNSEQQLRECLKSIVTANRKSFNLSRVVVVDNASTDGSAEELDDISLPLTVIRNAENLGFAAACNQGAKGSTADYLLFLNPDTKLFPESLSIPIQFMGQPENAKIGICGIKMVDEDGKLTTSAARFPSLKILIGKITGLSKILPKIYPNHLMSSYELVHSTLVDQIIGAFFLVRRNVFIELGEFDERYFVYFEEVDFSMRAKMKGYSSYYLTGASAYHKGGGCSENAKADRLFYSLRSRIYYGLKYYSYMDLILLISLTFTVEFAVRVFFAQGNRFLPHFRETLSAYKKLLMYFTTKKWVSKFDR